MTPTDPIWGLILFVLAAALVVAAVAGLLSDALVAALAAIERRDQRREAQDALTFGEPTRTAVESAYGPLVLYGPSGEAYDGTVDLPRRGGVA